MALIDHWTLDQSTGNNAVSVGSNANTIGIFGNYDWRPAGGRVNGAIELYGDNYLNQSNGALTNFPGKGGGPGTFSVAAWVYIKATIGVGGARQVVLAKNTTNASTKSWALYANDWVDGLYPFFHIYRDNSTPSSLQSSTAITANAWHHIAASYEYVSNGTSRMRLYLDGVLVGTRNNAAGPLQTNFDPFRVGTFNNSEYFTGLIDDIRIYDHALSLAEVQTLALLNLSANVTLSGHALTDGQGSLIVETPFDAGLIDYWRLDQSSGNHAVSIGQNGNTVSIFSGYTWQPTGGYVDGALQLDGTSYLNQSNSALTYVPASTGTRPTSFSIAAWVKITGTIGFSGNRHVIMSKQTAADRGFVFSATDQNSGQYPHFGVYKNDVNGSFVTGNQIVQTNVWQHHCVTYEYVADGTSRIRLYLNGNLVGSNNTAVGPPTGTFASLKIGAYDDGAGYVKYLTGLLDEVQIYDYPLTEGQVRILSGNTGAILNLSSHSISASLGTLRHGYPNIVDLSGQSIALATGAFNVTQDTSANIVGHDLSALLGNVGIAADSDLYNWLAESRGDRTILVEATYHDGTQTGTVYLSNTGYISRSTDTPASTSYVDALIEIPEIYESISESSTASIIVENQSGERDDWITDYSFAGLPLTVYIGSPDWERWQYREILTGVVSNLSTPSSHQIQINLADKTLQLEVPLQNDFMTGDLEDENVLVPIALGKVIGVPAVLMDEATHRYKVHEGGIVSVDQVRVAGVSRSFTDYESLGEFTLTQDWGDAQIVADVTGETTGKTADIIEWLALRAGLTANEIDSTNFNAFQNRTILGYWSDSDTTIAQAMDEVLKSVGGFKRFNSRGILQIFRLDLPVSGGQQLTSDDILEDGLELIEVQIPRKTTQLGYYRRWSPTQANALDASIGEAWRALLTQEYRRVYSTNPGIEDQFPLAETTGFIPTLIVWQQPAQQEANRRRDIRKNRIYTYRVRAYSLPFEFNVGDSINVTFPRYGFQNGRDVRILSVRQKPTSNIVELEIWGP